jgi:hypothetical protein
MIYKLISLESGDRSPKVLVNVILTAHLQFLIISTLKNKNEDKSHYLTTDQDLCEKKYKQLKLGVSKKNLVTRNCHKIW